MTLYKKSVFAIATFAFAGLALAGLEVGIEFFYPVLQPNFVSEVTYDGIEWYQINRRFLKEYFPADDRLVPEFKPSLMRKQKTATTFRILCLGESSMFGVPYQMTGNIPAMVRLQLQRLHPEREIEVINLGASAINTNVILHLTKHFLRLKPDLVLIYTGHNEFYGPDGVGASWLEKQFPSLTHLKYDLRGLSLVRLLQSLVTTGSQSPRLETSLMQQVSNGALVQLNSRDAHVVFNNFERNLSAITQEFRSRDIPVIVSDVTSNMCFSPFASDSSLLHQHDAIRNSIAAGNFEAALKIVETLTPCDSADATRQFLLGSIYAGLGDLDRARSCFESARDNDLLKFRAPGKINLIIRNVCSKNSLPFFSSDSIFRLHSRNRISDTSLFWEHLHPTSYGYYLIANGFVEMIQQQKLLPLRPGEHIVPFNNDSLHISWLDRAFADRSIANLTSKWPFKNFNVTQRFYLNGEPALKSIVDEVYSMGKVWDEACYETAQIFWSRGNLAEAITTYRAVIDEYPYNFYAHYLLANALSQTGNVNEAVLHYTISIRSNPEYPYPKLDIGLMRINLGKFDDAILILTEALQIAQKKQMVPMQATIYYGLGTAYANKREYKKALTYADQALLLQPRYRDAILLKEKILSLM